VLITPNSMVTPVTPGTAPTARVMSDRSLSLSGQPATVSSSSTRTVPSAPSTAERTMPRSVIGRRISGSSTVASAAWIASSAAVIGGASRSVADAAASWPGTAGADMSAMLRRRAIRLAGHT
jgi:hypothetical protein